MLTYSGAVSNVEVYLVQGPNVSRQFGVTDAENAAVPAEVSGRPRYMLFMDDLVTSSEATPGGTVNLLKLWDRPLTQEQIQSALNSHSGVTPESGVVLGGYTVTIVGTNLCNGVDVTDVTLCGVSVQSITSQSATQIVVVASAGTPGLGDVRVFSTSFGETVRTNGFTYQKIDTTTVVVGSPNPSSAIQSVTFTATVSPSAASGTVTFKDGITTLGTGILSSGTASYTNSALAVGAHSITAEYAGDASCAASTSGVLTQTVTSLVANDATYQRAAGLPLRIRIADIAWDTTGKPVTLLSLGTSGRGATLTTNSTYIFYQPQPGQDFGDLFTYTVTNGSDTNTGTIYVVVPLVSGGIAKSITCSGGTVTIKFFGIPGERYDVERATSLVEPIQWETVSKGTLTPEADGSFIFTDPSPPQSGSAYYRSVQYVPAG